MVRVRPWKYLMIPSGTRGMVPSVKLNVEFFRASGVRHDLGPELGSFVNYDGGRKVGMSSDEIYQTSGYRSGIGFVT